MSVIKTIGVDSLQDLKLKISVIGYYPQGECILLSVINQKENDVKLSVLFDSFFNATHGYLKDELDDAKLSSSKPLDAIIWTHPDKDHSLGLNEIITDYTGRESIVLIPDGLNIFDVIGCQTANIYAKIKYAKLTKKFTLERVNTSNKRYFPMLYRYVFRDGLSDDMNFDIEILTPFADDVVKRTEINKHCIKNDISISTLIRFGSTTLFFGGDVENYAINKIDRNKLLNLSFVKIPHHGSNSSNVLPAIIQKNNDAQENQITAVSTCFNYGCSSLPQDDVLDQYQEIANKLYLTDCENHNNSYGIVKLLCSTAPGDLQLQSLKGDAVAL